MALVSAIALSSGWLEDIASQVNAFTVLACRPVGEWGPAPFGECAERTAVLLDAGYGSPTTDCLELARAGDEASIIEDVFHERLRTSLQSVGERAHRLYRDVRESIVRRPCRTRIEVLEFAQEVPELAGDIPFFFRRLPASALNGRMLRLCKRCASPLFSDSDKASYPIGRCAIRECRMTFPVPEVGQEHEVTNPEEWRLAASAIMTYWVGPGLPEVRLFDDLRRFRDDVELYPFSDAADLGIGGVEVGIDLKSYSSAAVIGRRFADGIGGLRAFRRRIVAVPNFWLRIDRDYLATARAVSGCREGIEFMSVSDVLQEFSQ